MSMKDQQSTLATDELARAVIARIAPDELPQFALVAQTFHRAPERRRLRAARRNEPLGIGADGVVALLSVPTLYVASKLAESLAQKAADDASTWLTARLSRVLRRPASPAEPWQPKADELAAVREAAAGRARRLGLSDEQVDLIADGIVAELALRTRAGE